MELKNHEGLGQGQAEVKFVESSMVEDSPKIKDFEIYFKEIKLFHLFLRKMDMNFTFLNSLGTLLEKKQFIEFNSISCTIPRVYEYYFNITNYAFCVLGIEEKGRNIEKYLSLNPFLMWHEVSFVELELFLDSRLYHVRIIRDTCAISFGGGLFLVVPSTSKCVSSYDPLKKQLVINYFNGVPSCFDCELVHDDSFYNANVGGLLEFNCASIDVFHERFEEKYVENFDPILSLFRFS
ncbi:hypothetical protein M9H77_03401 [Catharanthus roseus]|uniref:Uncharacterized protein n=1 Tax=Catharanthus roseus TaxID=4058 RepID=A0ACC0CBJ7_CATRO|nr:hypothetical protein M9H77_03401 [Catharanthus roseus]